MKFSSLFELNEFIEKEDVTWQKELIISLPSFFLYEIKKIN